jgi:hypothetical protein
MSDLPIQVPFALIGAAVALAAAVALVGRRGRRAGGRGRLDAVATLGGRCWPTTRRGIGPGSWGGR